MRPAAHAACATSSWASLGNSVQQEQHNGSLLKDWVGQAPMHRAAPMQGTHGGCVEGRAHDACPCYSPCISVEAARELHSIHHGQLVFVVQSASRLPMLTRHEGGTG
jgi:hypothetical protein